LIGVAIYGGFPASWWEWEERDWDSNLTILSGDIAYKTALLTTAITWSAAVEWMEQQFWMVSPLLAAMPMAVPPNNNGGGWLLSQQSYIKKSYLTLTLQNN
jgi:hypothetical protein